VEANTTLTFHGGILGSKGRCVYWQQDLTLAYDIPTPKRAPEPRTLAETVDQRLGISLPSPFFLMADTLTMIFDGTEKKLISLDAYTNRALWRLSQHNAPPEVKGRGTLQIESPQEDDDRRSLQMTPRYEISHDEKWVRIVLNDVLPEAHYEVARNLVVGLAHYSGPRNLDSERGHL